MPDAWRWCVRRTSPPISPNVSSLRASSSWSSSPSARQEQTNSGSKMTRRDESACSWPGVLRWVQGRAQLEPGAHPLRSCCRRSGPRRRPRPPGTPWRQGREQLLPDFRRRRPDFLRRLLGRRHRGRRRHLGRGLLAAYRSRPLFPPLNSPGARRLGLSWSLLHPAHDRVAPCAAGPEMRAAE